MNFDFNSLLPTGFVTFMGGLIFKQQNERIVKVEQENIRQWKKIETISSDISEIKVGMGEVKRDVKYIAEAIKNNGGTRD